jgi:hypothetical protein
MVIKTEKWIVAEGDAAQAIIGLNKATIDRLLKIPDARRASAIALYVFYAYTARWQRTTIIRATDSFVAKALGWGRGKVIAVKKCLLELDLIELAVRRGIHGRAEQWYVRVKYVVGKWNPDTGQIDNCSISQTVVESNTNASALVDRNASELLKEKFNKEKNGSAEEISDEDQQQLQKMVAFKKRIEESNRKKEQEEKAAEADELLDLRLSNSRVRIPEGLNKPQFEIRWGAFIKHRKLLKAPMNPFIQNQILKRLNQRPSEACPALDMAMEKGWRSFKWEWFDKCL